jgi:hypothetical protein
MLFMRDMICSVCGTFRRDEILNSPHVLVASLPCEMCGETTEHVAACNGGQGMRYRCNDFPTDPRFYRGQVEVTGHSATVNDKPVANLDGGGAVQDRPQFADSDRRGARREKHYWESDHKRGRTPLYFDGHAAGKTAAEKK